MEWIELGLLVAALLGCSARIAKEAEVVVAGELVSLVEMEVSAETSLRGISSRHSISALTVA